jgi:hypothetical protein
MNHKFFFPGPNCTPRIVLRNQKNWQKKVADFIVVGSFGATKFLCRISISTVEIHELFYFGVIYEVTPTQTVTVWQIKCECDRTHLQQSIIF